MEKLRYADFWRKDLKCAKGVALSALKMYMQTLREMNVGPENEVYRIMVYNARGYIDAIEEIDGVLKLEGEEFERKAADLVYRCGYKVHVASVTKGGDTPLNKKFPGKNLLLKISSPKKSENSLPKMPS